MYVRQSHNVFSEPEVITELVTKLKHKGSKTEGPKSEPYSMLRHEQIQDSR